MTNRRRLRHVESLYGDAAARAGRLRFGRVSETCSDLVEHLFRRYRPRRSNHVVRSLARYLDAYLFLYAATLRPRWVRGLPALKRDGEQLRERRRSMLKSVTKRLRRLDPAGEPGAPLLDLADVEKTAWLAAKAPQILAWVYAGVLCASVAKCAAQRRLRPSGTAAALMVTAASCAGLVMIFPARAAHATAA